MHKLDKQVPKRAYFSGCGSALELSAQTYGADAERLAVLLDVGPLHTEPICHGYATGCACERCTFRAQLVARGFSAMFAQQVAARADL